MGEVLSGRLQCGEEQDRLGLVVVLTAITLLAVGVGSSGDCASIHYANTKTSFSGDAISLQVSWAPYTVNLGLLFRSPSATETNLFIGIGFIYLTLTRHTLEVREIIINTLGTPANVAMILLVVNYFVSKT